MTIYYHFFHLKSEGTLINDLLRLLTLSLQFQEEPVTAVLELAIF